MSRDPSTIDIKIGDRVRISVPCSGDNHDGENHELEAGCLGQVWSIDTYTNDQGLAITVVIPVDDEHNIVNVNVFDELDGPIENFLEKIDG